MSGLTPAQAVDRYLAGCYEEDLAKLRAASFRGWSPDVSLTGAEHLEAALARGKGAILWIDDFEYCSLVAKMALASRGYQVSHLSRPEHGFLTMPFGARHLNRFQTRVEDRNLYERVVLTATNKVGAMKRLRQLLEGGGIVSITIGVNAAQTTRVPFLGGELELATGPTTLARETGSQVLPVFTLRQTSGAFVVQIEAPLSPATARDDATPYREYAAVLQRHLRLDPLAWRGWKACWQPAS